jgi:DNA-binding transcriptional regulator LsrR (DeoR family)
MSENPKAHGKYQINHSVKPYKAVASGDRKGEGNHSTRAIIGYLSQNRSCKAREIAASLKLPRKEVNRILYHLRELGLAEISESYEWSKPLDDAENRISKRIIEYTRDKVQIVATTSANAGPKNEEEASEYFGIKKRITVSGHLLHIKRKQSPQL